MTRTQHKAFDNDLMFWSAQDMSSGFTQAASPVYSDTLDIGGDALDQHDPGEIAIDVSGIASGGNATVQIDVCSASSGTPTTSDSILKTQAYALADLQANPIVAIPIPRADIKQKVRLAFTIGTADLNGGTVNAGIVH